MRQNPLKRIVELQKQGKSVGIYSVCSANRYVIEAALKRGISDGSCVLIESTANQCDQNGGYTGMKPADFKEFVLDIAEKAGFDRTRVFLGGDHLGPLTFAGKDEAEAMADAASSVAEHFKGKIAFINVMKNLSVDCDCCVVAEDPCMKDIGVLASLDPIAIDQACIDLVLNSDDPGRDHFMERVNSRNGIHTIEAAADLGFGSRNYELLEV